MDVCGRGCNAALTAKNGLRKGRDFKQSRAWSENVQFAAEDGLLYKWADWWERKGPPRRQRKTLGGTAGHDAGLESMLAGAAVERCAVRREILYWRSGQHGVLPVDLPRADGEREKCAVFCDRRRCCGSGISAVSALQAGMFARDAGVDGDVEYGFPRAAAH